MLGTCDWCEGATWRWGEQQGGGCVVETELEIGGEWWVHSGNVVAIYLEVTVGLTNEGDLLQYLHSLFYTETYIASPLMNPDSLLEGSVVGGCWMGVPLALLGLVVEEEKYCFSCTINSSLSKHTGTRAWLSGISGLTTDPTASIIHPAAKPSPPASIAMIFITELVPLQASSSLHWKFVPKERVWQNCPRSECDSRHSNLSVSNMSISYPPPPNRSVFGWYGELSMSISLDFLFSCPSSVCDIRNVRQSEFVSF